MAIVQNIATEDGDILVIKTDVPVVGIISLTSFIDVTVGETSEVYFEKTFRYSVNGGLVYSDWMNLTDINIQSITIERVDYFIVEYKYKRVGVGGDLEFDSVDLVGIHSPLAYPIFDKTIFSDFFTVNDVSVLSWALNVLEKLYKSGIIPNYVTRNQGADDSDYVSFWFTITHFFAILVNYGRSFENITSNSVLMREFVKGRGVYMRSNPDVEELNYIYVNYITEIRKRGTIEIFRRDSEIDGELLRLLDYVTTDEFLFSLVTRGELGWCIGQSSPLYTGADNISGLIKGYEFTESVEDLTKYPLINEDYLSLVDEKIEITNVPDEDSCGIGAYGELVIDEKVIVIDPSLDYEISFRVEKSGATEDLTFGVRLFDIDGNEVLASSIIDGSSLSWFFTHEKLNRAGTEYWIRGVLHSHTTELIPTDTLNVGFGQNLRSVLSAVYMIPIIVVSNKSGVALLEVVKIRDIKIRLATLWFSRGLLSSRNFIVGLVKNHSVDYSNQKVEKIIDEELTPYNTFSLLKFL